MITNTDLILLFIARIIRMFTFGFLSLVLVLYLVDIGLTEFQTGVLLTATLIGDAIISLGLTVTADRFGRRFMLSLSSFLITLVGLVFIQTNDFTLLILTAIIGIISPNGYEIGPFLAIEQAALSQLVTNEQRTQMFAWYNFVGTLATASGALLGGFLVQILQNSGMTSVESYQVLLLGYALSGIILAILFTQLSAAVEIRPVISPTTSSTWLGLHRSRPVVIKLSMLFALDSFGGGFVVQSLIAYWFHVKFGVATDVLGSIFFGAHLLAAVSALLAAKLANRFGLINTMVFTHIPSNLLLTMIPLMPTLPLAIGILLARFSISQMDVPTRQSYVMAVVNPDERSAAAGVVGIGRSLGASLSPALAGFCLASPWLFNLPFFLAGGLKIVYDLILYRSFQAIKPPEEMKK